MKDYEFLKFYDSVKAESWPSIQSYSDFVKLPKQIIDECYNDFNLDLRKREICDLQYWINLAQKVLVYENLAYVPLGKCASTHYGGIFLNKGWRLVPLSEVDLENTNFFGGIIHPMKRYLKGLTEVLTHAYADECKDPDNPLKFTMRSCPSRAYVANYEELKKQLRDPYFRYFISEVIVGDGHSLPYHQTLGSLIDKVYWMPLDILTDEQQAKAIEDFCAKHGHNIDIPLVQRARSSSTEKLEIYTILSEINANDKSEYKLNSLLAKDLGLYYRVIDELASIPQACDTLRR